MAVLGGGDQAEFTVAHLEEEAGQILQNFGSGRGPQQADGLRTGGTVFHGGVLYAVLVVLQQLKDAAVFDGSDGTHAVPDGGALAANVNVAVDGGVDDLVIGARLFYGDVHIAAFHIKTVTDGDGTVDRSVGLGDGGRVSADEIAVIVIFQGEAAPEFQQHPFVAVHAGILLGKLIPVGNVFCLGAVGMKLIGGMVVGVIQSSLDGHKTKGGTHVLGIIGNVDGKHEGGGVILAVLVPVQHKLIAARV